MKNKIWTERPELTKSLVVGILVLTVALGSFGACLGHLRIFCLVLLPGFIVSWLAPLPTSALLFVDFFTYLLIAAVVALITYALNSVWLTKTKRPPRSN